VNVMPLTAAAAIAVDVAAVAAVVVAVVDVAVVVAVVDVAVVVAVVVLIFCGKRCALVLSHLIMPQQE
jgi:hypothetical protein